ncbi:hypothetical protein CCACVL1_12816 [Corchorus capsularis]|uniref:CCHC-type domain-containing protein n=1 Tax=Corchorus capsularis TaxID=210143 RepID=A0A1R3IDQ8_COCAP|nr:hypothetical protein CCACVL1_12816 [Corchorus capsularis]
MTVEGNLQQGVMEEDLIVDLDIDRDSVRESTQFSLIEKVISDRNLNKNGAMGVLQSIWPLKVLRKVFDLGPNLCGFSFVDQRSMEFALHNGPWTVMGHHLCLKRWDTSLAVGEIKFEEVNFWTQVHNLPLEYLTSSNARKIGVQLGKVVEIEDPDWIRGYGMAFLRVKIAVDIHKSLVGRFKVPRGNGDFVTAEVKYERLGDFCYRCGMLGHSDKHCEQSGHSLSLGKYGPWMRAAPIRGGPRTEVRPETFTDNSIPDLSLRRLESDCNNRRERPEIFIREISNVASQELYTMEKGESSGGHSDNLTDYNIEKGVEELPCDSYIEEEDPLSTQIQSQTVPKTPTKQLHASPKISHSPSAKSPFKHSNLSLSSSPETTTISQSITPKKRSKEPPIANNSQNSVSNDCLTLASPSKKQQILKDISNSYSDVSFPSSQTHIPHHSKVIKSINFFSTALNTLSSPVIVIPTNTSTEYMVELPPEEECLSGDPANLSSDSACSGMVSS